MAAQPVPEAGAFPGAKVGFVEARMTLGVKAMDEIAVAAAAGEHGVKVKPDVCWKAAGFAARATAALRLNGWGLHRGDTEFTERC